MSEAYCPVCRKVTPHKSIMRRCQTERCTKWQEIQLFLSLLMQGHHYYKMERQCFCRVCNHQNTRAVLPLHNNSRNEPRVS
ncbi:hypothetical protein [Vibrio mangrovi]|uniref:Uncharacterized protein n=1 Tax=Vibrio mangrovi TaxID=474394 RepID=A0A1Y6IY31_9VIBR|nr:hypothetical protein [Vibrio mangrovi]MDW6004966.1 hypothetical protein [Vibrio mangrovi]SMS01730.1 hypothetical protein VIM7927_03036 [Vibrio mangrovi]